MSLVCTSLLQNRTCPERSARRTFLHIWACVNGRRTGRRFLVSRRRSRGRALGPRRRAVRERSFSASDVRGGAAAARPAVSAARWRRWRPPRHRRFETAPAPARRRGGPPRRRSIDGGASLGALPSSSQRLGCAGLPLRPPSRSSGPQRLLVVTAALLKHRYAFSSRFRMRSAAEMPGPLWWPTPGQLPGPVPPPEASWIASRMLMREGCLAAY